MAMVSVPKIKVIDGWAENIEISGASPLEDK